MSLDCEHCSDLRARIEIVERETWMKGLYLIDGQLDHLEGSQW